jgi:formyltetrahydrofolate deformylase
MLILLIKMMMRLFNIAITLKNKLTHFGDQAQLAQKYQMNWQMNDASKLKRVLIMGSKSSHCVADLLHRGHESEMEAQIIGVLSITLKNKLTHFGDQTMCIRARNE